MKQLKIVFITLLLVLALAAAGCGQSDKGKVVAEVGDKKIYQEELDKQMEQVKATYEQQGQDLDSEENKEQLEELKKQVLEQMINSKVLIAKAEEAGIEITDEEINSELDNIKSQFENDEKYQEALEKNNVTEQELKDNISEQLIIQKFMEEEIPEEDISVSDEEVKDYYDKMKEQSGQNIGKFEDLEPQIRQMMEQKEMQSARSELLKELKEDMEIEKNL